MSWAFARRTAFAFSSPSFSAHFPRCHPGSLTCGHPLSPGRWPTGFSLKCSQTKQTGGAAVGSVDCALDMANSSSIFLLVDGDNLSNWACAIRWLVEQLGEMKRGKLGERPSAWAGHLVELLIAMFKAEQRLVAAEMTGQGNARSLSGGMAIQKSAMSRQRMKVEPAKPSTLSLALCSAVCVE